MHALQANANRTPTSAAPQAPSTLGSVIRSIKTLAEERAV